ncbi:LegC family aminotransferase [Candidatus Pelagibacter sp.]|uniref:LegC family aminotransferase n=1 Tax=Candidatus Pelagibacter sp. TaxID=2024849 RepID=UPI003F833C05
MKNIFIKNFCTLTKKKFKKSTIELHEPFFKKNEITYLNKCINQKIVSTHGKLTEKFEKKLSKYTKIKYITATNSGTSSIHIALIALGLKRFDEVLIPNLNYIASANCVLYLGGIPHFIDTKPETPFIDLKKLEDYLNKNTKKINGICINLKTKRRIHSIMTTHIFGHIDEIIKLKNLAKKFNIKLVEDASEALGSFFNNQHAGSYGDVGIISFNGNKIITTGGGGAIVTNSSKLSQKIRELVTICRKKNTIEYDYNDLGYNYRMPSINAALGLAQMESLKFFLKTKKKIYKNYKEISKNFEEFELIKEPKNCESNYWLQGIILKKNSLSYRNQLIKFMNKNGIKSRPVWKLMSKIKYLKKYDHMDLSNSINLEKKIINLPSGINLIYEK